MENKSHYFLARPEEYRISGIVKKSRKLSWTIAELSKVTGHSLEKVEKILSDMEMNHRSCPSKHINCRLKYHMVDKILYYDR